MLPNALLSKSGEQLSQGNGGVAGLPLLQGVLVRTEILFYGLRAREMGGREGLVE